MFAARPGLGVLCKRHLRRHTMPVSGSQFTPLATG